MRSGDQAMAGMRLGPGCARSSQNVIAFSQDGASGVYQAQRQRISGFNLTMFERVLAKSA
jgi:hypothetical protein